MVADPNIEKNNITLRYHIYIPDSVKKSLGKIPLPWVLRIKGTIDRLESEPFLGEKMKGERKKDRKIVVWAYRITYQINESRKIIIILETGRRGNVSYD